MTRIGIIGGSGLYALDGLENVRELSEQTPFGAPSDCIVSGELDGTELLFLPRHGRGHRLLPSEVPYRANIFALKQLGAEWVVSVSAVGSLQEAYAPGHMALPSQFVDRTHRRPGTFFGEGIVAHVAMADPVCAPLQEQLALAIEGCDIPLHRGGTYVCIEGPTFSTRAESHLYRSWGLDIIGMTALPEARLAREAELHYATVGLVTDYDCWRSGEADVDIADILRILQQNSANTREVLRHLVPKLARLDATELPCGCGSALEHAIISDPAMIPKERRAALAPLVGRYLG